MGFDVKAVNMKTTRVKALLAIALMLLMLIAPAEIAGVVGFEIVKRVAKVYFFKH